MCLMTEEYECTVGVDVSQEQIRQAITAQSESSFESVSYVVAEAECLPVDSSSVDLVTCSQAYHWLDWDRFHAEMKRVLRSPGCLAVYGYGLPQPQDVRARQLMTEVGS